MQNKNFTSTDYFVMLQVDTDWQRKVLQNKETTL